jgi:hypothetical protein
MKSLYYVCVESCTSNQIIYVYNYLCDFMHMFVLNQRLMVLHMSFFCFVTILVLSMSYIWHAQK